MPSRERTPSNRSADPPFLQPRLRFLINDSIEPAISIQGDNRTPINRSEFGTIRLDRGSKTGSPTRRSRKLINRTDGARGDPQELLFEFLQPRLRFVINDSIEPISIEGDNRTPIIRRDTVFGAIRFDRGPETGSPLCEGVGNGYPNERTVFEEMRDKGGNGIITGTIITGIESILGRFNVCFQV